MDPVGEVTSRVKSAHQQRVEAFMRKANQTVPESPELPSPETRVLRAKLILEEALETIEALGVVLLALPDTEDASPVYLTNNGENQKGVSLAFVSDGEPDLEKIADGCADLRVVTTGTLSACGIADGALQEEVDCNNLAKFREGHWIRPDGKLIKPPDHQPPDIAGILQRQRGK